MGNPKLRIVLTRESVLNALLLAYVALTPLFIIPVAGQLGTSDVMFFPAIAIMLLACKPRKFTATHFMMAIFLILVGVSLHATQDVKYVIRWVRLLGITLPFFIVMFSTLSLQRVGRVFFWSGLCSILIGIILWWFDLTLFADEANQQIWNASGESRVRAAGIFGNSGAFGALIAMWTVTCGMITISEKRPNKMVLAAIVLTALVALAGSTSRASALGIVVGCGVGGAFMFATHFSRRGLRLSRNAISVSVFVVLVTIATLGFVIPQLMDPEWLSVTVSRFDPTSHQSSNSFLSGRVAIWNGYLDSINQWPFFGVGYKQGVLHFPSEPHNQFLALAAETGIISLVVFLLFLMTLVSRAIGHSRGAPLEAMMCLAVTSTFVADGMGGSPLGTWQVTPITMIVLGICVRRFSERSQLHATDRSLDKKLASRRQVAAYSS